MMASRGMGAIAPSKMPKGKTIERKDNPNDVEAYAKGGWIKGAIKKPGALRESLGVKAGKTIPAKNLATAAKKSGVTGQRARLAQTLKGLKK